MSAFLPSACWSPGSRRPTVILNLSSSSEPLPASITKRHIEIKRSTSLPIMWISSVVMLTSLMSPNEGAGMMIVRQNRAEDSILQIYSLSTILLSWALSTAHPLISGVSFRWLSNSVAGCGGGRTVESPQPWQYEEHFLISGECGEC